MPLPLPSSTLTLSLSTLAVARSSLPSPLKSPTATEIAATSRRRSLTAAWKVPLPLPSSTLTLSAV